MKELVISHSLTLSYFTKNSIIMEATSAVFFILFPGNSYTYRALEALAVVVVIESFYPPVTCLNGETAAHTLGSEEIVPVC